MAKIVETPNIIIGAGNKEKIIKEYFGAVATGDRNVSIAVMKSPDGWVEPGQSPEFDEYTVVLGGVLHVETKSGVYDVKAGEAIMVEKGEWVRYSSPGIEGASYVAVCLPAFLPGTVHRDED
jgi:mannose-6-phosphate isomerase-like protein (cupin superfamily)